MKLVDFSRFAAFRCVLPVLSHGNKMAAVALVATAALRKSCDISHLSRFGRRALADLFLRPLAGILMFSHKLSHAGESKVVVWRPRWSGRGSPAVGSMPPINPR